MSMFKKTCFSCGNKVDELYESQCEDCYKQEFPPIKEIKPLNIKVCNMCGKIYLGHTLITFEELKERLPLNVTKNTILNEGYILNSVSIKNLKLTREKIIFDVEVDCDLKNS